MFPFLFGPLRLEEFGMKSRLLLTLALTLAPIVAPAQTKPVLVVTTFTTAADVNLPYDMKLLQTQLLPEMKVEVGKTFDVVGEKPANGTNVYTLTGEIVSWRPGNAAKRLLVGMGSGREAMDVQFKLTDGQGKTIIDRKETIRTNFYNQNSGSSGTLAHPIAQKLGDRIKEANIR
jgi:hypothetical protein